MTDEEKLKIIIEAQNKAQKAFDEANEQISRTEKNYKSMTDKMEASGAKMQAVGSKMTKFMTLPILGLGAVAFKAGAEMQDAMGAVDAIYKKSGETVRKWADSLPTYYGIAKTEAMQYASTMGSMLKNIGGLTEEEAAKQSATLIELAGDMTAMFGGSTEDAVRALTGALKGNNTMLDNYGISALEAEVKAEAFRKGLMKADVNMAKVEAATIKVDDARKKSINVVKQYGKESEEARKADNELVLAQQGVEAAMAGSTSEMDAATKQAATLSLIMGQTKDVQGQAAREAEGGSGKLRAMTTEMKNMSAEVGTKLLPVGIKLLGWGSSLIDMFGKLSPKAQNIILIILGLGAALGPVIYIIGTFVKSIKAINKGTKDAISGTKKLVGWVKKHGAALASNTKEMAKNAAASIKSAALKTAEKTKTIALTVAEKARTVATKIGTAVQAAFNAVMAMNPITLIVIAIVAFIAVLVLLYKKNKTVRDFINKSWKVVSETFMTVFNAIKNVVLGVFNWIKSNWKLILGIILGPIVLLIAGFIKYKDQIIAVFQMLWAAMQVVWTAISTVIMWAWNNVIKPIWDALVSVVQNILIPIFQFLWGVVQGAWNAIVAVISWAWNNVIKPIWNLIYAYITNILIPIWSKIFEAVLAAWNFMKPIFEAIWAYIRDTLIPIFQSIWDKVSSVFTNIWSKISSVKNSIVGAFNTVKDAISGLIDKFVAIKDKVASAFGGVKDAITGAFKSAFNWVADAWNKSVGKLGFKIPDWVPGVGGKEFKMPQISKLYKGVRNFGGGMAVVGDVRGQGGEIVHMPQGSDVYNNRESKRILAAIADGTFTPDANGGGSINTFTGNIYLMNAEAVKEFFRQLDRQGELDAMGVA